MQTAIITVVRFEDIILKGKSNIRIYSIKKAPYITVRGFRKRRLPTLPLGIAVPSAQTVLTSLFGMVRGGPRRHGHLSFGSDISDRGLRRNIVDINGTGSYKGKKHL